MGKLGIYYAYVKLDMLMGKLDMLMGKFDSLLICFCMFCAT